MQPRLVVVRQVLHRGAGPVRGELGGEQGAASAQGSFDWARGHPRPRHYPAPEIRQDPLNRPHVRPPLFLPHVRNRASRGARSRRSLYALVFETFVRQCIQSASQGSGRVNVVLQTRYILVSLWVKVGLQSASSAALCLSGGSPKGLRPLRRSKAAYPQPAAQSTARPISKAIGVCHGTPLGLALIDTVVLRRDAPSLPKLKLNFEPMASLVMYAERWEVVYASIYLVSLLSLAPGCFSGI